MKNKKILFLTQGALIAALYIALTELSKMLGIADGAIQCRLSEILCVLPYFTPAAIGGVTVGCFLSNLLIGGVIWDVIFGTLATFLGAFFAYKLRRHKFLVCVPTIVSNAVIVALVIAFTTNTHDSVFAVGMLMLTVGLGEFISCGVFGTALLVLLDRYESVKKIFTLRAERK